MLISQGHFDGPSAGPGEANGLPEAHGLPHGPPKVYGPGIIVPPCSPSRWPCPDPYSLRRLGAPLPDPVGDTFQLHFSLLNTYPNLAVCAF